MAERLYREWMRRLQEFLAARPPAPASAAAVRHDVAVRA
jgi:hypothetical protein